MFNFLSLGCMTVIVWLPSQFNISVSLIRTMTYNFLVTMDPDSLSPGVSHLSLGGNKLAEFPLLRHLTSSLLTVWVWSYPGVMWSWADNWNEIEFLYPAHMIRNWHWCAWDESLPPASPCEYGFILVSCDPGVMWSWCHVILVSCDLGVMWSWWHVILVTWDPRSDNWN